MTKPQELERDIYFNQVESQEVLSPLLSSLEEKCLAEGSFILVLNEESSEVYSTCENLKHDHDFYNYLKSFDLSTLLINYLSDDLSHFEKVFQGKTNKQYLCCFPFKDSRNQNIGFIGVWYSEKPYLFPKIGLAYLNSISKLLGAYIREKFDSENKCNLKLVQQSFGPHKSQEETDQVLLEKAGVCAWFCEIKMDPELEIISASTTKHLKTLLGHKEDDPDIDFETYESLIHPEDAERVLEENITLFTGQTKTMNCSYRLRKVDGSYLHILDYGYVYEYNKENQPKKFRGFFQDITSLIEARNESRFLSHSLSNIQRELNRNFIVIRINWKGEVLDINKNFELHFDDIPNLVSSSIIPKRTLKKIKKDINAKNGWTGELGIPHKGGAIKWLSCFGFSFSTKPQSRDEVMLVGKDITKEKQAAVMQKEKEKILKRKEHLALMGELSAGIGHEIKTPLTVITMAIDKCLKENKQENIKRALELSKGSVSRMTKIINGLYYLSSDYSSTTKFKHNLKDILKTTLSFTENLFMADNIKLIVNLDDFDHTLTCNELRVSQILLNLIKNSRDAIIDGHTSERWIDLSLEIQESNFVINVKDSGPGINDEDKSKLMDSFFTTKKPGQGSGLGLSLSRSMAKEEGGLLELKKTSSPTTFSLSLPKA